MTNEIAVKLSKMKDSENCVEQFEILHPYADNYIKLEAEYGLVPEMYSSSSETLISDLQKNIENLRSHPLIDWLNSQPSFIKAKDSIMGNKLIPICNTEHDVIKKYRDNFALEFICMGVIKYFTNNTKLIPQIVGTCKKKRDVMTVIKKLKCALKKNGGIFFSPESKQHLLVYLLDEMTLDEGRNIYSSGTTHSNLSRELFTKMVIKAIFKTFGTEISHLVVVNITLNLTSIFFSCSMDKSDASAMTAKILEDFKNDVKFRERTVGDILMQKGLELMKFC